MIYKAPKKIFARKGTFSQSGSHILKTPQPQSNCPSKTKITIGLPNGLAYFKPYFEQVQYIHVQCIVLKNATTTLGICVWYYMYVRYNNYYVSRYVWCTAIHHDKTVVGYSFIIVDYSVYTTLNLGIVSRVLQHYSLFLQQCKVYLQSGI